MRSAGSVEQILLMPKWYAQFHQGVFLFGLRMLFMRWALVILKSLVVGVLGTLLSLIALVTALVLYTRNALGVPPGTQVGWDVVSLFGPHWRVVLMTIPVAIFSLGFGLAFLRFSRRVPASGHRSVTRNPSVD